jgi:hypothetical protein
MYGRTKAQFVCCSAAGAMIAATTMSTPVASHTGRKRAATTLFATNEARRPEATDETAPVGSGVLTESRFQGGTTVKG